MPQPFENFNPQRDPEAVLAAIRGQAKRRAQVRAGIVSTAGLALLIFGGLWFRSPIPHPPPPVPFEHTPVVTRAWSGDRDASVVLFQLSPGRSIIFIQSNQEAIQ